MRSLARRAPFSGSSVRRYAAVLRRRPAWTVLRAAGNTSGSPLPQKWSEVCGWARREFEKEASPQKADDLISMARACLLIALEEEAAIEVHPELESTIKQLPIRFRSMAGSSTWSLERLDALAAEVQAVFLREVMEEGQPAPSPSANPEEEKTDQQASDDTGGSSTEGHPASPNENTTHKGDSDVRQAWDPSFAHQRIMALVHAVNCVLFERHGYAACNRYGIARDAQMSSVMENGVGCSAALSLLYMEVCGRLGVHMAAKPLESGRYFVLWPTAQPIMMDGQRFVLDPYGCGGLLMASEVCELFEVSPDDLWRPATRREMLAALLGELRDSYWAKALGCSPNPRSIIPLTLETALENKVGSVNTYGLQRCLAAAEKRLFLLPHSRDVQLEFALLNYFSGNYDDAWLELGLLLERQQQHLKDTDTEHEVVGDTQACEPLTTSYGSSDNSATGGATDSHQATVPEVQCDAALLAGAPHADSPEHDPVLSGSAAEEQVRTAGDGQSGDLAFCGPSSAKDAFSPASAGGMALISTDAWQPLDDLQEQQVRVLLEKVRLQLTFTAYNQG